ncbi:hypothetical protein GUITHDRAFT_121951 [Guillardia theta CCMP2712]|uniref:Pantothenate kinase n=1 Tax=Guillardia theta (strain CCMP2712) TaxID=905079 RepID=L1I6K0_GUITC|nr:hypothetical protein GUITHDRAFT_121951 [Guillardia theta CCMP2712]EKX31856.1 hypothetical protein GUITHDRAFT_121951 [Guillardia theta CCMP2712]|eukprot:XP_005818836.1 hypothetical protein GUITHDRAFT_121951 [Guillardia theta CCMP2712]
MLSSGDGASPPLSSLESMQHVNDEKAFKEQRGAAKSNCAFKNGEADGNSASRSNSQEALNGLEMRGLDEDNDNDARLKLYRRSLDDIRAELLPRTSSPSCGRNSFLPEGMLFGIDIGGTLAKIVFREPGSNGLLAQGPKSEQAHRLRQYFQTSEGRVGSEDERLYFSDSLGSRYVGVFGGKMHFLKLETSSIDFLFEILRKVR